MALMPINPTLQSITCVPHVFQWTCGTLPELGTTIPTQTVAASRAFVRECGFLDRW